ncbi:hypothetical protein HMPREF1586_00840, partial [Gardnerella vaginalis JCP8522]
MTIRRKSELTMSTDSLNLKVSQDDTTAVSGVSGTDAQESDALKDELWWKQASVYQIYPRSFSDSTGSGLGDIKGITSRMDYLSDLGIDAIWLSPFYPSHLLDGGYDVDDYRNVDSRLGTMDDFSEMV